MKFTLRNLGRLEEATIDLDKDLIVLTGPNNTSKTYVAHAIYGLCKHYENRGPGEILRALDSFVGGHWHKDRARLDLLEFINAHLEQILASLIQSYQNNLSAVFAAPQEFVARAGIDFSFTKAQVERGREILRAHSIDRQRSYDRVSTPVLVRKGAGETSWTFERQARLDRPSGVEDPGGEAETFPMRRAILAEAFSAIHFTYFSRLGSPFILTAERSAIQLFSRELSLRRTTLVDDLLGMRVTSAEQPDAGEVLGDELERRARRYPLAIRHGILFANETGTWKKETSSFVLEADRMENDLLQGAIRVDDDGDVTFQPAAGPGLTLHLASSSVKSLAGLSLFLRHIAEKNAFLIIDEPELNLHPDNQRRVARVLARLARAGVKVLISTHSDYVIRELNNLIMLSADKDGEVRKRHGYDEEEILSPAQVGAYLFDASRAHPIEVAPTGIEVETIDREINALNTVSQDIYFSLFDKDDA